jgi:hypothetical protein
MSLGDFLTQCPGRSINPVEILTTTIFASIERLHSRQGAKLDVSIRRWWPREFFLICGGKRVPDGLRGHEVSGLSSDRSFESPHCGLRTAHFEKRPLIDNRSGRILFNNKARCNKTLDLWSTSLVLSRGKAKVGRWLHWYIYPIRAIYVSICIIHMKRV